MREEAHAKLDRVHEEKHDLQRIANVQHVQTGENTVQPVLHAICLLHTDSNLRGSYLCGRPLMGGGCGSKSYYAYLRTPSISRKFHLFYEQIAIACNLLSRNDEKKN